VLIARLTEEAAAIAGTTEAAAITRARHRLELERTRGALDHFLTESFASLELRAEDLRHAASALGRITGRVDVEDVLDRIFADFCIGK
jgi:tRNA modification GTPase